MAIGMTDCRYRVDLLRGIRNLPLLCVCCQIRTEWVGLVSQIFPEAGVGVGWGWGWGGARVGYLCYARPKRFDLHRFSVLPMDPYPWSRPSCATDIAFVTVPHTVGTAISGVH